MLYIYISHFNWYRNYYRFGNGARTLTDLQTRFPWGGTFHQKSLERAGVMERFRTFLRLRMLHFLIASLTRSLSINSNAVFKTWTDLWWRCSGLLWLPKHSQTSLLLWAAIDSNRVNSSNIHLQPWKAPECKTSKRLVRYSYENTSEFPRCQAARVYRLRFSYKNLDFHTLYYKYQITMSCKRRGCCNYALAWRHSSANEESFKWKRISYQCTDTTQLRITVTIIITIAAMNPFQYRSVKDVSLVQGGYVIEDGWRRMILQDVLPPLTWRQLLWLMILYQYQYLITCAYPTFLCNKAKLDWCLG